MDSYRLRFRHRLLLPIEGDRGGLALSRFSQELLYHFHLAGCEDAFIATVAYGFEGIMDATSLHWTCRFVTTIRKLLLYYQQGFVVISTEVC